MLDNVAPHLIKKLKVKPKDGFHSSAEARRAKALQRENDEGLIFGLRFQQTFLFFFEEGLITVSTFDSSGKSMILRKLRIYEEAVYVPGCCFHENRTARYVADFTYTKDDVFVVEDVKGIATDVYKLKKKFFMEYLLGWRIKETI